MKRLIAVLCLMALLLAGCNKKGDTDRQVDHTTTAPTTAAEETMEIPEQIVGQDVSPLTGNWESTLDKGQYAALIYYLQTGGDEEYAMTWLEFFSDVTYPLQVTLELNEDGSYTYTVHGDEDQTGLEEFALSLYNGYVGYFATLNNSSEEAAKDYMADSGFALWDINSNLVKLQMDLMFAQSTVTTGTWEHNDQGLVLSGWCTVEFYEENGVMEWTDSDDLQLTEELPLVFTKK